jgi:hypothetical protein
MSSNLGVFDKEVLKNLITNYEFTVYIHSIPDDMFSAQFPSGVYKSADGLLPEMTDQAAEIYNEMLLETTELIDTLEIKDSVLQ